MDSNLFLYLYTDLQYYCSLALIVYGEGWVRVRSASCIVWGRSAFPCFRSQPIRAALAARARPVAVKYGTVMRPAFLPPPPPFLSSSPNRQLRSPPEDAPLAAAPLRRSRHCALAPALPRSPDLNRVTWTTYAPPPSFNPQPFSLPLSLSLSRLVWVLWLIVVPVSPTCVLSCSCSLLPMAHLQPMIRFQRHYRHQLDNKNRLIYDLLCRQRVYLARLRDFICRIPNELRRQAHEKLMESLEHLEVSRTLIKPILISG